MSGELLKRHNQFIEDLSALDMEEDIRTFKPYIELMAGYLPNNHEALMRFSTGLQVMTDACAENPYLLKLARMYQTFASLTAIHAHENGVDLDSHKPRLHNHDYKIEETTVKADELLSIDQTRTISRHLRDRGLTVGLLHGHFRLLTPSSIAFIINAHQDIDALMVGVESSGRTLNFKRKVPIIDDRIRAKAFRKLLLFPFVIDDSVEYSDEGYTGLVRRVSPDKYFTQSDNPETLKTTMRERAIATGCEYVELINLPGISTTQIKDAFDNI